MRTEETRRSDLFDRSYRRSDPGPHVRRSAAQEVAEPIPARCAREIVLLAQTWIPYGGPPTEEIFERFGMSPQRFTEVLRASLRDARVDSAVRAELENTYPRC